MTMSPGKPPLKGRHQQRIAPTANRVPPMIINCFPSGGFTTRQQCYRDRCSSNALSWTLKLFSRQFPAAHRLRLLVFLKIPCRPALHLLAFGIQNS